MKENREWANPLPPQALQCGQLDPTQHPFLLSPPQKPTSSTLRAGRAEVSAPRRWEARASAHRPSCQLATASGMGRGSGPKTARKGGSALWLAFRCQSSWEMFLWQRAATWLVACGRKPARVEPKESRAKSCLQAGFSYSTSLWPRDQRYPRSPVICFAQDG